MDSLKSIVVMMKATHGAVEVLRDQGFVFRSAVRLILPHCSSLIPSQLLTLLRSQTNTPTVSNQVTQNALSSGPGISSHMITDSASTTPTSITTKGSASTDGEAKQTGAVPQEHSSNGRLSKSEIVAISIGVPSAIAAVLSAILITMTVKRKRIRWPSKIQDHNNPYKCHSRRWIETRCDG